MPKRKYRPSKVTKTVVYGRRGSTKMRYHRSRGGGGRSRVLGSKEQYSKQKFIIAKPVITGTQPMDATSVVISHLQPIIPAQPPGTITMAWGSTPRWLPVKANWNEFAVTGVRIEYTPRRLVASIETDLFVNSSSYCSTTDDVNHLSGLDFVDVALQSGSVQLNPFRPFKKYISFKRFAK